MFGVRFRFWLIFFVPVMFPRLEKGIIGGIGFILFLAAIGFDS